MEGCHRRWDLLRTVKNVEVEGTLELMFFVCLVVVLESPLEYVL